MKNKKRPHQKVRDTSKEAFAQYLEKNHKARLVQVYEYIKVNQPCSRKMIAKGLKLESSQITQAVKTLIQLWGAVYEAEKKECKITGVNVYYLELSKQVVDV